MVEQRGIVGWGGHWVQLEAEREGGDSQVDVIDVS